MAKTTRRGLLKSSIVGIAASKFSCLASTLPADSSPLNGRIHQSVCQWCYPHLSLDQLSDYGSKIGLRGIDLLQPDEYEVPRRYGLICTMGYAGGGEIKNALNRPANHADIEHAFRVNIPRAAKAGVPNVITFSGNRAGMSDEEGIRNAVAGLNRVKRIAEDHSVTICMELLNSKHDHPDYMCDNTAWGVRVVQEVNSPNVKLLYDIYHMQIMEGDLIDTIRQSIQWIGHFHTGGVPGRHDLDGTQEVRWDGVMRAIADSGFKGYVAHEFVPTTDDIQALQRALQICDV